MGNDTLTRSEARRSGLKIYNNGPCKYGHESGRRVSNGSCIGCVRAWANANPDSNRKSVTKYQAKNRDKIYKNVQAWRHKNKDIVKQWRYLRRNKDNGFFTAEDINKLRKDQNGLCNYCDTELVMSEHIDHIRPISKGGSNWPENLQLLCRPCNQKKAAKYPYTPKENA